MKKKYIILFVIILLPVFFSSITYMRSMNGIGDDLSDQSYDYEFSCLYSDNETLYYCDDNKKALYKLNQSNDDTERIKVWDDDLVSLNGIIITGKGYVILDSSNQSVYFDDNYPGMKKFGQPWDPHMWDPVSIVTVDDILFVLDKSRNNIRRYNLSTQEYLGWMCKEGNHDREINNSNDLDVDNKEIYIADTNNNRVEIIDKNCSFISYVGIGREGVTLRRPEQIYVKDYM